MNVHNLAMVFAPNFLRCPSDNLAIIFESTKYEQAFLRTLLLNLNSENFFNDGNGNKNNINVNGNGNIIGNNGGWSNNDVNGGGQQLS